MSKGPHHTIKLLEGAMFPPEKKHASMVKSDAKQQESSLSETSSLSPHHHQVGGKLVIAINSPVACCPICNGSEVFTPHIFF